MGQKTIRVLVLLVLCPGGLLFLWALLAKPVTISLEPTDREKMVRVPGGVFKVAGGVEKTAPFWIDQFEVTERDWAAYCRRRGLPNLNYPAFDSRRDPDYPVRWVTGEQAQAFATSLFKRLPTNLEWERAARGPNDSFLPWGDAYVDAANVRDVWSRGAHEPQVTRVGLLERGRSAVGAYDMVGNVWEWTMSPVTEGLWEVRDEQTRAIREAFSYAVAEERVYHLIRGGGFTTYVGGMTHVIEDVAHKRVTRAWDIGFRCVISEDEVHFQDRVIPLVRALGWKDPWHWFAVVRPARARLVALGARALPYLREARLVCRDALVRSRIDDIVQSIREES